MKAADLRAETQAALAECRRNVERFRAEPPGRAAADVLAAFDVLTSPLNGLEGRAHLFAQVHPDAAVRATALELEQEISAFRTDLALDRSSYERLRGLDPAALPGERERRLLAHALRDYRRSGVDRDEATRARVRALNEELVKIGQTFDRNIIEGGRSFRIAEGHGGLAGLPQDFLDAHPEAADGSVTLSTDPQDRMPVLMYAERGDLRRAYHVAVLNRAMPDNLDVLARLLARRHELSRLLGYASWADYVTEDKMTGSAAAAREFIERVAGLAAVRAQAEYAELLELKQSEDPDAHAVFEWESAFLIERAKRRRFAFDSQAVRPYFAYARVRDGVLSTTSALYRVEFQKNQDVELWHPSVECYDVLESGRTIARLYLDMHPRAGKFKHGAMFDLTAGTAGGRLPEACLVCNFPEPKGGDPALLLHDQVTTFFHEFGHLMHHLFGGGQRFLRYSGIATEWDFVEVPSQMYEEWAWDGGVLARFARHHRTGEAIPEELVRRMRAAEEYGKSLNAVRQMFLALLSLSYYDRDPTGLDLTGHMIRLKRRIVPFPHAEGTYQQASFGHLHGYSAMYYTYMWSLVIAKDLFSRFDGDLMNTATANDYRASVLAPGGSRDAADLVRGFLGRDYGFAAFESWLGR